MCRSRLCDYLNTEYGHIMLTYRHTFVKYDCRFRWHNREMQNDVYLFSLLLFLFGSDSVIVINLFTEFCRSIQCYCWLNNIMYVNSSKSVFLDVVLCPWPSTIDAIFLCNSLCFLCVRAFIPSNLQISPMEIDAPQVHTCCMW